MFVPPMCARATRVLRFASKTTEHTLVVDCPRISHHTYYLVPLHRYSRLMTPVSSSWPRLVVSVRIHGLRLSTARIYDMWPVKIAWYLIYRYSKCLLWYIEIIKSITPLRVFGGTPPPSICFFSVIFEWLKVGIDLPPMRRSAGQVCMAVWQSTHASG